MPGKKWSNAANVKSASFLGFPWAYRLVNSFFAVRAKGKDLTIQQWGVFKL